MPTEIGGAGIAAIDGDRISIHRCCIRDNRTTDTSFGSVNFLDKLNALIASLPPGDKQTLILLIHDALVAFGVRTTSPNFFLGGQSFGGGVCFG
jgi:hypothetical protein